MNAVWCGLRNRHLNRDLRECLSGDGATEWWSEGVVGLVLLPRLRMSLTLKPDVEVVVVVDEVVEVVGLMLEAAAAAAAAAAAVAAASIIFISINLNHH